jgi:hypothetical protein
MRNCVYREGQIVCARCTAHGLLFVRLPVTLQIVPMVKQLTISVCLDKYATRIRYTPARQSPWALVVVSDWSAAKRAVVSVRNNNAQAPCDVWTGAPHAASPEQRCAVAAEDARFKYARLSEQPTHRPHVRGTHSVVLPVGGDIFVRYAALDRHSSHDTCC